jgi:hypothetical protein
MTMMTSGDFEVEKEPLVTLDAPVTSVPLAEPSNARQLLHVNVAVSCMAALIVMVAGLLLPV